MNEELSELLAMKAALANQELNEEYVAGVRSELSGLQAQGVPAGDIDLAFNEIFRLSVESTQNNLLDLDALNNARIMGFGCSHALGSCNCIANRMLLLHGSTDKQLY